MLKSGHLKHTKPRTTTAHARTHACTHTTIYSSLYSSTQPKKMQLYDTSAECLITGMHAKAVTFGTADDK